MRRIVVLNLILTLLITAALLMAPVYEQHSSSRDEIHGVIESRTTATLVQVNGPGQTACVLGVPLALSVLPIFSVRMTRISGFFLLLFALLGSASIGLCYMPGAAILLLARR